MPGKRPARLVWLERLLLVVGAVCLGYYGYMTVEARHFQRQQTAALEELLAAGNAPQVKDAAGAAAAPDGLETPEGAAARVPAAAAERALRRGDGSEDGAANESRDGMAMALLEIPRLRVSAPVLSGDGDDVLDVAVGHLPDTPRPWEPGNSALAGHRDGLFRPLRNIRRGDTIRVRSAHGEFTYEVTETKVVEPTDLSVLEPSSTDALTLITCYPFNYVGPAPQRFVVRAVRAQVPNF